VVEQLNLTNYFDAVVTAEDNGSPEVRRIRLISLRLICCRTCIRSEHFFSAMLVRCTAMERIWLARSDACLVYLVADSTLLLPIRDALCSG